MSKIRLHKFLANCGVASRRHSEGFIREGYVRVNDQIITEDGFQIDPEVDKVYFQEKLVKPEPRLYFAINKPRGFVCTNAHFKEPRVVDLFRTKERLYSVGRLDKDSEGLLIVTNDGELCQKISHPSYEVPKTYFVTIRGYVDGASLERMQKGIWLSDGKTSRTKIKVLKRARDISSLLVTITEGKKREIRRIFAKFGFKVRHLTRIQIGNLHLGNLKPGKFRQISFRELEDTILNYNQNKQESYKARNPRLAKREHE